MWKAWDLIGCFSVALGKVMYGFRFLNSFWHDVQKQRQLNNFSNYISVEWQRIQSCSIQFEFKSIQSCSIQFVFTSIQSRSIQFESIACSKSIACFPYVDFNQCSMLSHVRCPEFIRCIQNMKLKPIIYSSHSLSVDENYVDVRRCRKLSVSCSNCCP